MISHQCLQICGCSRCCARQCYAILLVLTSDFMRSQIQANENAGNPHSCTSSCQSLELIFLCIRAVSMVLFRYEDHKTIPRESDLRNNKCTQVQRKRTHTVCQYCQPPIFIEICVERKKGFGIRRATEVVVQALQKSPR